MNKDGHVTCQVNSNQILYSIIFVGDVDDKDIMAQLICQLTYPPYMVLSPVLWQLYYTAK